MIFSGQASKACPVLRRCILKEIFRKKTIKQSARVIFSLILLGSLLFVFFHNPVSKGQTVTETGKYLAEGDGPEYYGTEICLDEESEAEILRLVSGSFSILMPQTKTEYSRSGCYYVTTEKVRLYIFKKDGRPVLAGCGDLAGLNVEWRIMPGEEKYGKIADILESGVQGSDHKEGDFQ